MMAIHGVKESKYKSCLHTLAHSFMCLKQIPSHPMLKTQFRLFRSYIIVLRVKKQGLMAIKELVIFGIG